MLNALEQMKRSGGAFKIIFRYFAQFSIISDFDVNWPWLNRWLFSWPKVLRLDIFQFVDVRCLFDMNLWRKMCIYWIMPVAAANLIIFTAWLNNLLASASKKFTVLDYSGIIEFLGMVYGLFVCTIVKNVLVMFECVKHPNGRLTLAAMPDVECYVGEHRELMPVGVFFFFRLWGDVLLLRRLRFLSDSGVDAEKRDPEAFPVRVCRFSVRVFLVGPSRHRKRALQRFHGCSLSWRGGKPDRVHDVLDRGLRLSERIFSSIPG
jgi:hypothetical protein